MSGDLITPKSITQVNSTLPPTGTSPKSIVILNGEFDAHVWAKEWLATTKEHPGIPTDEGCMISWFANALMAGYDWRSKQRNRKIKSMKKTIKSLRKDIRGLQFYISKKGIR